MMITEKHNYQLILVAFVLVWVSSSSVLADMYCTSTSTYTSHIGANSASAEGDNGYCFNTPEKLNVTLYEFGICNGPATPDDLGDCSVLFESTAGEPLELSAGASIPVANGVSIPEGSYSHAYVILSTATSLEAVVEFATPRTADNGTTGVYCFTDGRSITNSASIISCGNDPSAVSLSGEVIGLGDQNGYSNTLLNYTVTMMGQSVVMDLYSITSTGVLSNSYNDDFALFGSQALTGGVDITANTSSIDIAFSVTDGATIGFDDPSNNFVTFVTNPSASDQAPVDAVFTGIKFLVTAR